MKEKSELTGTSVDRGIKLLREMSEEGKAEILLGVEAFVTLRMQNRGAIREMETKLNVLNEEL